MTASTSPAWIRERPHVAINHPLWHVEHIVTSAGIRVTSCAVVLAPDEIEQLAIEDLEADPALCPSCREHMEHRPD